MRAVGQGVMGASVSWWAQGEGAWGRLGSCGVTGHAWGAWQGARRQWAEPGTRPCTRFATKERDGLLLYNGRFNEKHDFVALEIVGEQVQLTFSAGMGTAPAAPRHGIPGIPSRASHAWHCLALHPWHMSWVSHPWHCVPCCTSLALPGTAPQALHPWHCILGIASLALYPMCRVPGTTFWALPGTASQASRPWCCSHGTAALALPSLCSPAVPPPRAVPTA